MVARLPELIIVGDEAYTPEEWGAERLRRERKRARDRERNRTPERLAYNREHIRRWRERNPDYAREWMRRKRGRPVGNLVGSLHSLRCTGPTQSAGCRCSKVKCYDRPVA